MDAHLGVVFGLQRISQNQTKPDSLQEKDIPLTICPFLTKSGRET
jgi:hypothetical protein